MASSIPIEYKKFSNRSIRWKPHGMIIVIIGNGLSNLVWFGLMAYQPLKVINAKSIFIDKAVLFQTIQFSISTQFQCQETVPFQTIQFSISTEFNYQKQFYFKQFSLA